MQTILTYLILLLTGVLISFSGFSQTPYQKGMQKGLDLWIAEKPNEAVNLFERIATAEPNEWLPSYYASYITIIDCFGEKDEAKLKAQMEKALQFMNDAKTINKEEVELLILDALWHTVWVAHDGTIYGMKYGGKIDVMYQQALVLEANNPRVILNKAEWDIGGAKFFGQPIEPYCNQIQKSIDLFKDYQPRKEFYPSGGIERAKNSLKENCN
ncbi:MAG: hypothetical protein ACI93N_002169 [Flavobacteriaceae bacterium]|jgi:hypothetical protein